jgi:predicted regulator of Ras-like GTPase activity (Roadblock/LC7/MglB family)
MSREQSNRDENLRKSRLVFYENDVQRLNAEIDTFLELSKARCALLVDRDGHLVTRRGEPVKTSEETISALIAGSFAATREMARLLGENEFAILFHQGSRDSIQLQLIGERTLLATLFDGRTNLGMVRFYAQETAGRIDEVLVDIHSQNRSADLNKDFESSASDALDKLF